MLLRLFLGVLPLAIFAVTAESHVASQTASDTQSEQQVRKLNAEEVEAFLHNDAATMERLWSDDFVVTNPLNKFVSKQQVLGMVRSGFLAITSFERRIEYVKVYENTVILAGSETCVWGGKMPNFGKRDNLRFTAVWMKQNGRWQEIARHANIIPESKSSMLKAVR